MNPFDLLVLALLLVAFAVGLYRGLARESSALLHVALSLAVAVLLSGPVGTLLDRFVEFSSARGRALGAWTTSLALVYVFLRGLLLLIASRVGKTRFRGDRLPGGILGAAAAILLLAALFVVPAWSAEPGTRLYRELGRSRSIDYAARLVRASTPVLFPPHYRSLLDEVVHSVERDR